MTSGGKRLPHRGLCGAGFELQLPGCPHRGGPDLECEQLGGAEKRPAETPLLESAQEK